MEHIRRLHWLRNEKKDLSERIQNLDYEIAELTNLSAAPISDMPKGNGVSNPTEKYVMKLTELKNKRQNMILKSVELENETEEFISKVNDSEIRVLMRKYFIDGCTWNEIAREYYKYNCDGSTPRKKVSNYLKRKGK